MKLDLVNAVGAERESEIGGVGGGGLEAGLLLYL